MSITLTIKQIMAIADFAGLVIDESKSFNKEDKESFIETEFTIEDDVEVSRDGKNYYKGKAVHCTEYPEEGYLPLDEKIEYTCVSCLSKSDVSIESHNDENTYTECNCGERCEPSFSQEIIDILKQSALLE